MRPGMSLSLARGSRTLVTRQERPWRWLQGARAADRSVARGAFSPQGCSTESAPFPVRLTPPSSLGDKFCPACLLGKTHRYYL